MPLASSPPKPRSIASNPLLRAYGGSACPTVRSDRAAARPPPLAAHGGKYLQAARAMESLTWIYCRRSFGTSIGRAHAPIITCLAESNPLRPTQYIRLERRLRCNRGLARPLPIIGIGLAIMIASATIPQCFCEYRHDFFNR